MKILLPVDGSSYTQRMLSHLDAHEELLGKQHLGSVATGVIARLQVPVLLVR